MLKELVIQNEEENSVSKDAVIDLLKEIVFAKTSPENERRYAKEYAYQIWKLAKKNNWVMTEYFSDMTRSALKDD